ncbi:virulence protein [Campylobacter jejuni]|nr:virulence protein [Campylobacter jejuni]
MAIEEEKKDLNFLLKWEQRTRATSIYVILVLFITNIITAISLMLLMPLKTKEPYLLFFSNYDTNFVTIKKANQDLTADENLVKSLLAGYVKNRESINRINDTQRYEETRMQSSVKVWKRFQNLVEMKNSIYTQNNIFRDINIINVSIQTIKNQKGIALVDYTANIYNNDKSINEIKKYRATLEFLFQQVNTNDKSVIKNPTGFMINNYNITEIIDIKN